MSVYSYIIKHTHSKRMRHTHTHRIFTYITKKSKVVPQHVGRLSLPVNISTMLAAYTQNG